MLHACASGVPRLCSWCEEAEDAVGVGEEFCLEGCFLSILVSDGYLCLLALCEVPAWLAEGGNDFWWYAAQDLLKIMGLEHW